MHATHRGPVLTRSSDDTPCTGSTPDLDWLNQDLRAEMQRLAAENTALLASLCEPERAVVPVPAGADSADDVAALRQENAQLRRRLSDLEQTTAPGAAAEQAWAEGQRIYEALLEEKSEVIRALHQKIEELQERPSP